MRGEVALTSPHLMDSARNELVEAYEGVGGEARQVMAVYRGREVFSQLVPEFPPGPQSEDRVSPGH